jgi:hypothetical protein
MQVDLSPPVPRDAVSPSAAAVTAKITAIRKLADELENEVGGLTPPPAESPDAQKSWGHLTDHLTEHNFAEEWFRSLRLFRHWSESTYETLAFDADSLEAYRTAVPQAALSYVSTSST